MTTMATAKTAAAADPVAGPEAVTDAQAAFYKDEGYVLLKGLMSPADAEAIRAEVAHIMEVVGLGTTKLRQSNEYLHGSRLESLIHSPHLKAAAGRLMEGPATLYLPFTAVKSGGGGGEFHYHQDNQYTRFDAPGINMWFALVPMTEQNGCLKVVPRSHTQGTFPSHSPDGDGHKAITFEPEEFVSVVMEPGDCVAFSRLTVHGSGPNSTPEHRTAYAVQFHRDDVNYSVDGGETWKNLLEYPRWKGGPVEKIAPPQGKLDGH